jgi:hypothetical protein
MLLVQIAVGPHQLGASGSAVGFIGEVITDGVGGVVVEPGHPKLVEALTALIADELRRSPRRGRPGTEPAGLPSTAAMS